MGFLTPTKKTTADLVAQQIKNCQNAVEYTHKSADDGFVLIKPKKLTRIERFLQDNGFDVNNLWQLNKNGHTPISLAISLGKKEKFLNALIEHGASVNQPHQVNGEQITPLQQAVVEDNPKLVSFLLKNNADFNQIIKFDGRVAKRLTALLPDLTSKTSAKRKLWVKVQKQLKKLGAVDGIDPYYLPQPPIENLVFEGGGAKGTVYVGALQALEQNRTLAGVKRVAGSSAGGITAMLVALGYSAQEIAAEMEATDFTDFMDGGNIFKQAAGLIWNSGHGLYEGKVFHTWAKNKVEKMLGDPNATFSDLRKAAKSNPQLKELYITGTNLSTQRLEVFSADTTPDMKIADAVRITMSFPGAFQAFPMKKGNGEVQYYADGGIKNNYPMHIFDERRFVADGYSLDEVGGNPCTLGFKVDSESECSDILWQAPKVDHKQGLGLFSWVKGLFGSLKNSDNEATYRKHAMRTIQIHDHDIGTLQFQLTDQQKGMLRRAGKQTTRDYFNNYRTGFYAIEGQATNRPELDRRRSREELAKLRIKLARELRERAMLHSFGSPQDAITQRALNKRTADLARATGEDLTQSMLFDSIITPPSRQLKIC